MYDIIVLCVMDDSKRGERAKRIKKKKKLI